MNATRLIESFEAGAGSLSRRTGELKRAAMNLPQKYADYVATNATSVTKVENGLRSLMYLLPGARLRDTEIASESLHSFIQLLSIYHDHLLRQRSSVISVSPTAARAQPSKQAPRLSAHARYTIYWTNNSSIYDQITTILKITQYTELLWEMVAKRRGREQGRWKVVVFLEAFKALCKLILLRLTNLRPLVNPLTPHREAFAPPDAADDTSEEFSEEELAMVQAQNSFNPHDAFGEAGVPTPPISEPDKTAPPVSFHNFSDRFTMPRTGSTLPNIPSADTITSYLLSHVMTPDDIKPATRLLRRMTSFRSQAAEVLYILRPVVYALLMQNAARGCGYEGAKWKKSWTPWLAGISIEYLSRQLAVQDQTSRAPGGTRNNLSALEREELTKRGWNMGWWSMRGAFYENVTRHWVLGVADKLKGKPLLDIVGGVIEDYDHLWQYHFTSWND